MSGTAKEEMPQMGDAILPQAWIMDGI